MASRLTSAVAMAFVFAVSAANARPVQKVQVYDIHGIQPQSAQSGKQVQSIDIRMRRDRAVHHRHHDRKKVVKLSAKRRTIGGQTDPRPRAWCGWWLRQQMGVADRAYNLARKWAGWGTAAHGPAPGVVAVWRHHVGIVTGVPGPGRIVLKSGNDSHAVRERERSTRGIIAYRWPPGRMFAMQ